jgi:hypothetical protein
MLFHYNTVMFNICSLFEIHTLSFGSQLSFCLQVSDSYYNLLIYECTGVSVQFWYVVFEFRG